MKALTIHQPWASLIIAGVKRYETRTRRMNYRGTLAIHAAAMPFDRVFNSWGHVTEAVRMEELCMRLLQTDNLRDLPKGCILGTVEVVDCLPMVAGWPDGDLYLHSQRFDEDGRAILVPVSPEEWALGNYDLGRYAIQLADPKPLPEPIPARGQQGLWNWEPPECPECHGLGEVGYLADRHDPASWLTAVCPTCHGEGWVSGKAGK
ncbi:MAG: ASCH domain-containing protein [Phycisphaerales bacterium]